MQLTLVVLYDGIHWNNTRENIVYAQFNCEENHAGVATATCDSKQQDLHVCPVSCSSIPVMLIVFDRAGALPVKF